MLRMRITAGQESPPLVRLAGVLAWAFQADRRRAGAAAVSPGATSGFRPRTEPGHIAMRRPFPGGGRTRWRCTGDPGRVMDHALRPPHRECHVQGVQHQPRGESRGHRQPTIRRLRALPSIHAHPIVHENTLRVRERSANADRTVWGRLCRFLCGPESPCVPALVYCSRGSGACGNPITMRVSLWLGD